MWFGSVHVSRVDAIQFGAIQFFLCTIRSIRSLNLPLPHPPPSSMHPPFFSPIPSVTLRSARPSWPGSNTSEAHQCDLCVLSGSVKPALLGRLSPLGLPWQPNSISSSNNGSSYSSADEAKSHSAGSGGGSIDRDGLGIFRSGGGGGVFRSASGGGRFSGFSSTGGGGGGGIGGDKERFLTSREADLWSKLVELRDLTAQEPSACFPVGLGERGIRVSSWLQEVI